MSQLQNSPLRIKRGTTAQHNRYAGPVGELTADTTKNTVVLQTGSNGGSPMAKESVRISAGTGVTVNNGASATLASATITIAADEDWIDEKVAGATGTTYSAGNGLTLSGTTFNVGAGTGITVAANTVGVNESWLDGKIAEAPGTTYSAGNGLTLSGTTFNVGAGTGITVAENTVSANATWVASQVVNAVRTDTDLIVGGNGLTESTTTGGKTLAVGAGTGISVAANAVSINTTWLDSRIESVTNVDEIEAFRKSMIGVPRPWRSTTLPANHCWANGDLVSFVDWPELEEIYDAGGFAGMLMAYAADSSTQSANLGKWRPNASNPTGLYTPNYNGRFLQAYGSTTGNGTSVEAGLPNIEGYFVFAVSNNDGYGAFYEMLYEEIYGSKVGEISIDSMSSYANAIDASRSNIIYGNSNTVQPPTIRLPYIIYLGTNA